VKDWLMPSLDPILDQNQFGCRPGRSTTHALVAVLHKRMKIFDNRGSVRAVFIDSRKAFDIVNHNTLLSKLKMYNATHCLLKWFGSNLSHRRHLVMVGQLFSSWKTLSGGMPQGSRLGPLSFIVLINDLRAACEVHKFVDTAFSELIPSTGSVSNMQSHLTSLLTWTANNDMQINTSKTKEMALGLTSINLPPLSTSTRAIERFSTFKLLGIFLDTNLSWSAHNKSITSKASKRLYFLKQLKRAGVPYKQLLHF